MKNCLKITGLAVAGAMIASSASAAITGTFVGAQDGVNTFAEGGGSWASGGNAVGHWFDRSGNPGSFDGFFSLTSETSATGSGGYQPSSDDATIITTISGLAVGQQYEIGVVYNAIFGNTNLPLAAGFSASSQTQMTTASEFRHLDETSAAGFTSVFQTGIGTAVADTNGEIDVYLNPVDNGAFLQMGYNGVTYTAVPEPGSLALLGLGGLGLLRRRR